MSSRPDIPLVMLVFGLVLAVPLHLAYPSGNLQGPGLLLFLGILMSIFLYSIYWGLVVRRGMAVRLYRNQALGMALVSLGLLSILIVNAISLFSEFSNYPILASNASFEFRSDLYGLLILFWVDSSMLASQDMDPLSRDSIHWSKLRFVLWGLVIAGMAFFVGFLALTGNYGFFDNPPPGLTSGIISSLAILPFVVPLIAGIVTLPIGALRSNDRNFRRQLQWFAVGLLLLFGLNLLAGLLASNSGVQGAIYGESFLVTAYCFYRSTRALVPLNRISLEHNLVPKLDTIR